jgi:hypothetical protein
VLGSGGAGHGGGQAQSGVDGGRGHRPVCGRVGTEILSARMPTFAAARRQIPKRGKQEAAAVEQRESGQAWCAVGGRCAATDVGRAGRRRRSCAEQPAWLVQSSRGMDAGEGERAMAEVRGGGTSHVRHDQARKPGWWPEQAHGRRDAMALGGERGTGG